MTITYKDDKSFRAEELAGLFDAVGWSSGRHPLKLQAALLGSHRVRSAWDGERLVGLINVLADGCMTAYIHFLLVRPEYQQLGIGRKLLEDMLTEYKDYLKIFLVADRVSEGFYKKYGFHRREGIFPVYITSLED
jgi:ribosomal protein S18 acetylase RimI-like enzyme